MSRSGQQPVLGAPVGALSSHLGRAGAQDLSSPKAGLGFPLMATCMGAHDPWSFVRVTLAPPNAGRAAPPGLLRRAGCAGNPGLNSGLTASSDELQPQPSPPEARESREGQGVGTEGRPHHGPRSHGNLPPHGAAVNTVRQPLGTRTPGLDSIRSDLAMRASSRTPARSRSARAGGG